jgi:hypothetical protein
MNGHFATELLGKLVYRNELYDEWQDQEPENRIKEKQAGPPGEPFAWARGDRSPGFEQRLYHERAVLSFLVRRSQQFNSGPGILPLKSLEHFQTVSIPAEAWFHVRLHVKAVLLRPLT